LLFGKNIKQFLNEYSVQYQYRFVRLLLASDEAIEYI